MKKLGLLFLILCPFLSFSQDTIYTQKGKAIFCKIKEVNDINIIYVKTGKSKDKYISLNKVERHTFYRTSSSSTSSSTDLVLNEDKKLTYKNNKVVFERTFNLKGITDEELMARFKHYMNQKSEGVTKSIKSEKVEICSLLGKGVLQSSYDTYFGPIPSTVNYTINFSRTNGEVMIEIYDIFIKSEDYNTSIETWDSTPSHFIRNQIDHLLIQFDDMLNEIENSLRAN